MTIAAVRTAKSSKSSRAHLDSNDETIIEALCTISTAFYNKAQKDLNTGDSRGPDYIFDLVSKSRRYAREAHSYERKQRIAYEQKQQRPY